MNRARVVVSDDQTLMAEGLRSLLKDRYEVVGIASNGLSLIETTRTLKPDVVVVDVSMKLLNGIDAGRQLRKMLPKPKLVFIAASDQCSSASAALEQGSCGYLIKDSASTELLKAIEMVLQGRSYVAPAVSRQLRDNWEKNLSAREQSPELTDKQRAVLQLLAEGKSMKEAGRLLGLSERTIAFHKYKVMRLYHLENNAELIQFAMKQHIIATPIVAEASSFI